MHVFLFTQSVTADQNTENCKISQIKAQFLNLTMTFKKNVAENIPKKSNTIHSQEILFQKNNKNIS